MFNRFLFCVSVLLVACFRFNQAAASTDWVAAYEEKKASGTVTCAVRSPSSDLWFYFYRKDGMNIQLLRVAGRKYPRSQVFVNIDGKRFEARENDMSYWASQEIKDALLPAKEVWVEWRKWPSGTGEDHIILGNFRQKYDECQRKMNE